MPIFDKLSLFFEEHKEALCAFYPGMTFHRLWQEWSLLSHFGYKSDQELREASYSTLFYRFTHSLLQGMPLPYISGKSYFYNLFLSVGPGVLIPRYETEILVHLAHQFLEKGIGTTRPLVVDVGTGSGAILLALSKEYTAPMRGIGIDLSQDALRQASYNHFLTAYERPSCHDITFVEGDRLSPIAGQKVDLILSNPPYLLKSFQETVHFQVRRFEPEMALYIDDKDFFDWYAEFFQEAHLLLKQEGVMIMESDPRVIQKLKELALNAHFGDALIVKDFVQQERFLVLSHVPLKKDGGLWTV